MTTYFTFPKLIVKDAKTLFTLVSVEVHLTLLFWFVSEEWGDLVPILTISPYTYNNLQSCIKVPTSSSLFTKHM